MRAARAWLVRLRGLFGRDRLERELAEELESHVLMHADDNVRAGMSPEEARRLAVLRLGGVEQAKELYRDRRGVPALEALWQDLRFGARLLRKDAVFTAAAVASLAIGVGASAAVFSVYDGVLLRPLPFDDPGSLERVANQNGVMNQFGISAADFMGLQELYTCGRVAAAQSREVTLGGGGTPEFVRASFASAELFDVLGVRPALGRAYLPEEGRPGGERVALVTHGLWTRRFGASPDVVGRTVTVDGVAYAVVGVLPPDFVSPFRGGAELWPVLQLDPPKRRGPFFLSVVSRRDPGVSPEESAAALREVAGEVFRRWARGAPDPNATYATMPLEQSMVGEVRPTLQLLLGAVGLVLLVASVNVANLLVARAVARRQEIAVRAALGASRLRLVRQLVAEGALLAALGGAAGFLLAFWGTDVLLALAPDSVPRLDGVRVDGRVLAFAAGCAALSALVLSLVPALHGARRDLAASIAGGGKGSPEGAGPGRLRGLLVVAEIALALPLLCGAGLTINSFVRLSGVDPGFEPRGLLTMRLALPAVRYPDPAEDVIPFFDEALRRARSLPGVRSAAVTSNLPLDAAGESNDFALERHPTPPGESAPVAEFMAVSADYFRAMGIPLLEGRLVEDRDGPDAPSVAVISRALAERHFPGEDPIGMRLKTGGCSECDWTTIVGVVGDVKDHGLGAGDAPAMYVSARQEPSRTVHLVLRGDGDPQALLPALRREIRDLDPELALSQAGTAEELMAGSKAQSRYRMTLLGAFAAAALLLAVVGIYGVTAYVVSRRTREIGIRLALGAGPGDILWLVVRQGMAPSMAGIAAGVVVSLALARLVSGLLYGVSGTDPATFAAVVAVLGGAALVACYVPARRALKVDPLVALRYE